MRTALAFVIGVLVTLITATHLTPSQTQYETVVQTETVIDVDLIRMLDHFRDDSQIDPNLADQLYIECVHVIEQHTDEPLMGIMFHLERTWSSDACAAADHLLTHGWY